MPYKRTNAIDGFGGTTIQMIGSYSQQNLASWSNSSSYYISPYQYKILYGDNIDFRIINTAIGTARNLTIIFTFIGE